jgi:hypothetical protein
MGHVADFNLVLADIKQPHFLHCVVPFTKCGQELQSCILLLVTADSQKIGLPFAISPIESVTVSDRLLSFCKSSCFTFSGVDIMQVLLQLPRRVQLQSRFQIQTLLVA